MMTSVWFKVLCQRLPGETDKNHEQIPSQKQLLHKTDTRQLKKEEKRGRKILKVKLQSYNKTLFSAVFSLQHEYLFFKNNYLTSEIPKWVLYWLVMKLSSGQENWGTMTQVCNYGRTF
jgi:hypothetical protein